MKLYHPCPKCYGRNPVELPNVEILENNPDITSILRCQDCGYIYRIGKNGKSLDFPKKNVYFRKIKELSCNENLTNVFKCVKENKNINITELSKKLKISSFCISRYVSELEENQILEARYLKGQRILTIAETKATDLFGEFIQE